MLFSSVVISVISMRSTEHRNQISGEGLGFSEQHQDRSAVGWDQSDDFWGSKCQGGATACYSGWRIVDLCWWLQLDISGKHTKSYGKSLFLMGKSIINGNNMDQQEEFMAGIDGKVWKWKVYMTVLNDKEPCLSRSWLLIYDFGGELNQINAHLFLRALSPGSQPWEPIPIASRQGIVFSQFGSMLEYLGLQDVGDAGLCQ